LLCLSLSLSISLSLSAGIVSKSYECRLKGQGAAIVETLEAPGSQLAVALRGPEAAGHEASVQQVIIIQGYGGGDGGEVTLGQAELEESAATTLHTLAMAGQVAKVLHITEDGQLVAAAPGDATSPSSVGAAAGTRYVVLDSGGGVGVGVEGLQQAVAMAAAAAAAAGKGAGAGDAGHPGGMAAESVTALDALLSAVSELGQQEEMVVGGAGGGGEETVVATAQMLEVVEQQQQQQQEAPVFITKEEEMQEVEEVQEEEEEEQQRTSGGMEEVLQFAASQMMKEGVTQVIINHEGTHYIVTELDDYTLQVEEATIQEETAEEQQEQQLTPLLAEQQPGGEMVVFLDGAPHKVVLEG